MNSREARAGRKEEISTRSYPVADPREFRQASPAIGDPRLGEGVNARPLGQALNCIGIAYAVHSSGNAAARR